VGRLFKDNTSRLTVTALLVFVPLGFVDAAAGSFSEVEEGARATEVIAALAAGFGGAGISLFGEVLYAGIVAATVGLDSQSRPHSLRSALRTLPVRRLIAADLLYGLLVVVGLLLLVVPGLVFLTWFALVAPVIESEDRRPVDALRRSRSLVRHHAWRVAALIVPLVFLSDLLSEVVFSGALSLFGDSLGGEWAGTVLGELISAPAFALFVLVLFVELRSLHEPGAGANPTMSRL
jgi:hypothetical protein